MWATGFPASEVLLETWGSVALAFIKLAVAVPVLCLIWIFVDGWQQVRNAPWRWGCIVGGIGFGFGAILLLIGQVLSDPVTPAIAAAMMPIAGAFLEVVLDGRKLTPKLLTGITLALAGGYLATGAKLEDGTFGTGALLCLSAVVLFAWATRATTRDFQSLSPIGQTAITLAGGLLFSLGAIALCYMVGLPGIEVGNADIHNLQMFVVVILVSFAIAQTLWIWGTGGLGILLASFHMNAVPFYVMVIVVWMMGGDWNWGQAWGAALVAAGVTIAQFNRRRKTDPYVHPE